MNRALRGGTQTYMITVLINLLREFPGGGIDQFPPRSWSRISRIPLNYSRIGWIRLNYPIRERTDFRIRNHVLLKMVLANFKRPWNTKQTFPTLFHAIRGLLFRKNCEAEYAILTKPNKTQTRHFSVNSLIWLLVGIEYCPENEEVETNLSVTLQMFFFNSSDNILDSLAGHLNSKESKNSFRGTQSSSRLAQFLSVLNISRIKFIIFEVLLVSFVILQSPFCQSNSPSFPTILIIFHTF